MAVDSGHSYETYQERFGKSGQAVEYTEQYRPRGPRDFMNPSVAAGWVVAKLEALAFRRLVRKINTDTVVDIPCGSGKTLGYMSENQRSSMIGIDSSRAMLALVPLETKKRAHVLLADIRHLPLIDGAATVVACIRFLHRFPSAERMVSLKELTRASNSTLVLYYSVRTPLTDTVNKFERILRMGDRKGIHYSDEIEITNELTACGLRYVRGIRVVPLMSTGFMVLASKESENEAGKRN